MKRNLLRAFALLLMAVILTTAFVCNATYAKAEGEPFTVNNAEGTAVGSYADWAAVTTAFEEWAAAETDVSGYTIKMNAAYTAEVAVVIPADVTLDLNGCTLSVKSVVGVNGTHLVDNSEAKTGLVVTTEGVTLSRDNASLPVHNGTGYMLLQPNMSSTYQKFVRQTDGSYYFAFRPGFGKVKGASVASTYLANGNNGLEMRFTVLTKEDGYSAAEDGLSDKTYYFDAAKLGVEDVFKHVYGGGKMFFCRLNGAEDLSQLRIKTTIVSDTGVYYSAESTAKAIMADFGRADNSGAIAKNSYVDTVLVRHEYTSMTDHVLHIDTTGSTDAKVAMDGIYNEMLGASPFCIQVKFSDFTTTATSGYNYIAYFDANGDRVNFIRLNFDGSVYVHADGVGTVGNAEDLLQVYIDPAAATVSVYNVTQQTVKTGTLKTAIATSQLRIYVYPSYNFKISDFKVYTDANAVFGDLLSNIQVEKDITLTLDDGDNADGLRPANVKLQALNSETKEVVKEVEVPATTESYTFTDLPVYDDYGTEITYTFNAVAEHYVASVADTAITLTHTPAVTYYYDNDFDGLTVTAGDGNTQILDAKENVLNDVRDMLVTGTDTDGNTYLELKDTAGGANSFCTLAAGERYFVSFRIRLAEGADMGSTKLRLLGSKDSSTRFGEIKFNALYVRDNNSTDVKILDFTNEWTNVTFYIDGANSTYQVGDADPVGFVYIVSPSNSFIIQNNSKTVFSGLYIDDLKIYAPYESVDVTGEIAWSDFDDADGSRPESVTVNLYNGSFLKDTVEVTADADGNWLYSFEDLPKTNATEGINADYAYRVELASIPEGYTAETVDNTITLSHTPANEKDVTVTWTVDDGNDADGLRPDTITLVALNGETQMATASVDVTQATSGTYTFENLPLIGEDGNVIDYTFTAEVEHYATSVADTAITLTHTPSAPTYYYDNNFEGLTVGAGDGTTEIKDANDNVLTDVRDALVTGTDTDGNTYLELKCATAARYNVATVTTGEPYCVSFRIRLEEGTDMGDTRLRLHATEALTTRFGEIKFEQLYIRDNVNSKDILILDLSNEWTYVSFYIDGANSTYQVGDADPVGFVYDVVPDSFIIQNYQKVAFDGGLYIDDLKIYAPYESVDVTGEITWSDLDDADGSRPESVTVNLYNGSFLKDTAVVTADADGNWIYSFEDLPKTNATVGCEGDYEYSVALASVPDGYTKETDGNNFTLSHTPTDRDATVTLIFDDYNDVDCLRPDTVKLQVLNGATVVKEMEVAAISGTYTFENLPVLDEGGNVINYTYTAAAEYYKTSVEGAEITLTYTPDISVIYYNDFSQAWTISGSPYTQILDDPADEAGLSVMTNGYEIKDGYLVLPDTALAENDKQRMFLLGASENLSTIQFKVKLPEGGTLGDANDIYLRGSGSESNKLLSFKDGKLYSGDEQKYINMSDTDWVQVWLQVDTENSKYYYRFTNGTEKITGEGALAAALVRFELYGYNGGDTLLIDDLLTYTEPADTRIDMSGELIWSDDENSDGSRPESVTVNLYNGTFLMDTAVVTADETGNWNYSFKNLPVTNITEGLEGDFEYRVELASVPEGYIAETVDGTITLTRNFT